MCKCDIIIACINSIGLECKGNIDEATTAVGIYNGRDFSFLMGQWKLLNGLKALWHYGFSIVRMNSLVTKTVKDFSTIYDLQGSDVSFLDVPSFLTATVGEQGCKLTLVSAETHLIEERGYSERLVREVVTAALRMNYGQNAGMNAFATLVALAGMKSGSLWNVVGGNKLIAEKLLEASKATLHHDEVTSITRTERDGKSIYTLKTLGNSEGAEYDSVIIACPLNTSSIEFERFPNPVNTKTATSPFQRTVANFIRGEIDPGFFGQAKDGFPLTILTTDLIGSPFEYRSVAVQIPSTVSARQVNEFKKSIVEDPVRTWKVFSPQPLTGEQLGQMFSKIDDVAAVDWLAYPVYNPPEEFSSFKLDDGVFYINAIEKAASAMEMSVIGAKNASLLTREYLLIRRDSV